MGVVRVAAAALLLATLAAAGPAVAADPAPVRAGRGSDVIVSASGFPPKSDVLVMAGEQRSEGEILLRLTTDGNGRLRERITIPAYAEAGTRWVVVVRTADRTVAASSASFVVSPAPEPSAASDVAVPGAEVRVSGTITDDGIECLTLRGDDGKVYSLATAEASLGPGDRVHVVGSIADMSYCMQGTTIEVERLERVDGHRR